MKKYKQLHIYSVLIEYWVKATKVIPTERNDDKLDKMALL